MKDLEKMSPRELEDLARQVTAMAEKKKDQFKKDLRKELVDRIRAEGFTVGDIFPEAGTGARGRKKSSSASNAGVKFQDPNNPENTWSGAGRLPNWLKEAVKQGHEKEEFAV
ncbi:H-NS histone family protein [Pararhodobacter sp. SW119]|uniref:H-NS histone family protein n=1 Tax=Pararhodobacter sp. SW119 TaxID=2780075 RepID=UPI001AE07D4D